MIQVTFEVWSSEGYNAAAPASSLAGDCHFDPRPATVEDLKDALGLAADATLRWRAPARNKWNLLNNKLHLAAAYQHADQPVTLAVMPVGQQAWEAVDTARGA